MKLVVPFAVPNPWLFNGYMLLDHLGRYFGEQVKNFAIRLESFKESGFL
jgi:hypothetical protein